MRRAISFPTQTYEYAHLYIFTYVCRSQFPHKSLRVAVTPNGLADAVVTHEGKEWFGMPEEVEMTMTEFLDNLDTPK